MPSSVSSPPGRLGPAWSCVDVSAHRERRMEGQTDACRMDLPAHLLWESGSRCKDTRILTCARGKRPAARPLSLRAPSVRRPLAKPLAVEKHTEALPLQGQTDRRA